VALLALAGLVVLFGPALVHYVPLSVLRLAVGGLLLVFGLQWLRKAVLRAAGLKAKHDEDAIFAEQVAELSEAPPASGRDATAFSVAFKGVFLEGLEVVVIVITLGTTSHRLGLAAAAAAAAAVGGPHRRPHRPPPAVRRPRERHEDGCRPDAGQLRHLLGRRGRARELARHRPGHPRPRRFYGCIAWLLVASLRHHRGEEPTGLAASGDHLHWDEEQVSGAASGRRASGRRPVGRPGWLRAFGRFWWDFLIGDTPELFVGAVAVIGVLAVIGLRPGCAPSPPSWPRSWWPGC